MGTSPVGHRASIALLGPLLTLACVSFAAGEANPLIGTLWENIPREKESEETPGIRIDATELIPKDTAYYTYAGSLTTPPCSEGVTSFVLRNPVTLSPDQIARFSRSYPMNARPVQPLNGRQIRTSR